MFIVFLPAVVDALERSTGVTHGPCSTFLTSHSIRNCWRIHSSWHHRTLQPIRFCASSSYCSTRPAGNPAPTFDMASRRACLSALEGRIVGARGASSSPRRFSSNWTTATCQNSIQTKTTAALMLPRSSIVKMTSLSWLQTCRQFSSTPASRHGHLDPPRPGEEYVKSSPNRSNSDH